MGLFHQTDSDDNRDEEDYYSTFQPRVRVTQHPQHHGRYQYHPSASYRPSSKYAPMCFGFSIIFAFAVMFYVMVHSMVVYQHSEMPFKQPPRVSVPTVIVYDRNGKIISSSNAGGIVQSYSNYKPGQSQGGNVITTRFINGKLQKVVSSGSSNKAVYYQIPSSTGKLLAASFQQNQAVELPEFQPPPPCRYQNLKVSGIDIEHDIPMRFSSRHLVIGIAADIDIKNFAIFCGSLRDAQIDATTIIFMNAPVPSSHQDIANKHDIILLAYTRSNLFPIYLRTYHPSSLRWIFMDWLFTIKDGYYSKQFDYILTLDIRDSVFQTDPFLLFRDDPLFASGNDSRMFVFGENPNIAISSCSWNSNWIKDCFSERIYNLIKIQPIVCSGISMGSTIRMVDYLNKMSQIMLNNFPCIPSKFPLCERNGVDQGVHNVLVHLDYLAPVAVKYPETFPIVNLQSTPDLMIHSATDVVESIRMSKVKKLFAVVHQYDRDPKFQLALGKKYLPWIDWNNPIGDWAQTPACTENFGVVFGMDLFKGRCDLMASRAMTPATCCTVCMNQRAFSWRKYYGQLNGNASEDNDPILQLAAKIIVPTNINTSTEAIPTNGPKLCTSFTFSAGVCYLKQCPIEEIQGMVTLLNDPNFKDVSMANSAAVSGYFKVKGSK